jgi:hypothetical protein
MTEAKKPTLIGGHEVEGKIGEKANEPMIKEAMPKEPMDKGQMAKDQTAKE